MKMLALFRYSEVKLAAILMMFSVVVQAATTEIYETELDAVIAASDYYNPISIEEDREFMGAVFRHKTLSYYTYDVQAGQKHQDRITIRFTIPEGYEWVALWHTHGKDEHKNRYFSAQDTRLAKQVDKPLYLADGRGDLKVFYPDGKLLSPIRARGLGLGYQAGLAKGERLATEQGERIKIATTLPEWLRKSRYVDVAAGEETVTRCCGA